MSEKLETVIKKLEEFAPTELSCVWDNTGWQIFLSNNDVKKIMLCVTPSIDVIEQAVQKGCDLIVSHHPLIFDKLKKINAATPLGKTIALAVKNNIQIYSMHTNLDSCAGGLADRLAEKLGLAEVENFNEFVRIGSTEKNETLETYLSKIKTALNLDKLRLINPAGIKKVRKVALCPGGGGDFIGELKDIDLYVTADIKYHQALAVQDYALADAGHFETERVIIPNLKEMLARFNVEVFAAEEKSPWVTI